MASRREEVVVITGASSGIGRATALRFAREGARVALLARSATALEEVRREVEALGARALVVPIDVADAAAIERAAEAVEQGLGPIDVWVGAAVVSMYAPVLETSPEEYRRITEVGYLGQVYGAQSALRRMVPRNRGAIILVGSGLGYRAVPLQSAYCASKFALRGFAEALQGELQHMKSRVRLTLVAPATIDTPFYSWAKSTLPHRPNAVGPVYTPELVADAIFWATRHRRRELAVGWPSVLAREGSLIAPRFVDWMFGKIGYRIQQTRKPNPPDYPTNLWEPLPGGHAVRGEFGDRAHTRSPQLWLTKNRGWLFPALVATIIATGLWRRRR